MRIALVGYMHGMGGIQTHTHFLAEGLQARGNDVCVITPMPMKAEHYPARSDHSYRLISYQSIADFWEVIRRNKRASFDAVIVCGTGWKAMIGALLGLKARRKVFFEVMSGARSGVLDPRVLVHAGFDAIVGQAPQVEKRFCAEFHWTGRSEAIPALPNPLELCCVIPPRMITVPVHGTKLKAAYFGRLAPHKGVRHLLERWKEISEFVGCLDIWGSGDDEAWIREKIRNDDLGDAICLKGAYPGGREYVALMQNYDVKLLPTVGEEGAPLVLLEAMACGLPFVANGVGGIPQYDNPDCAITSGDVEEFVPLLQTFHDRLHRGDVDLQRLQQHYATHFSFEALVTRWQQFLESELRIAS